MKKLFKSFALLALTALTCVSLASCGTPSPEEIYEEFESDNAKIVMKMSFSELVTAEVEMEVDGDKCKVTTTSEALGTKSEAVSYLEKDGDKEYEYTEADGKWSKSEHDSDDSTDVEELEALFDTENYEEFDKDSSKYVMKDDVKIEADGMTFSNAEIKVGEDTYTLTADIDMSEGGIELSGELKLTVSDFGKMSVTLPEV